MRVAFAGKGGSGKSTLASLFTRHLAAQGLPVIVIDADINQHLADALGASAAPPALGAHLPGIKDYLRGTNPRITSAAAMVKTTPPGRGSRLLRVGGDDPIHALAVPTPCGARLLATGPFSDDDIGVACYHAKTGAVELYLNHLLDSAGEYVVVDCTAGAESFASGLFTRFDLTFLVTEPTRKSLGVCRQWASYADGYHVPMAVVGNKTLDEADTAFLREHTGDALLTCFGYLPALRAIEQGRPFSLNDVGPQARAALAVLQQAVDARVRDWEALTRQAAEFHLKNASAWANAAVGQDLTAQIDPDFTMSPHIWQAPPPGKTPSLHQ
jgi:CO dehydrogenase maturation factor